MCTILFRFIGWMRILSDLHVHHPFSEVKQPKHNKEGILHFRWLAARVIKKNISKIIREYCLSLNFTFGSTKIFKHPEWTESLLHPIFYNDKVKYKMIHALKDLQKQNPNAFLRYLGVKKIVYGFETWWSRLSNETHETILGGVYFTNKTTWSMIWWSPKQSTIFFTQLSRSFWEGYAE